MKKFLTSGPGLGAIKLKLKTIKIRSKWYIKVLKNILIARICKFLQFQSPKSIIYPAHECYVDKKWWHGDIYLQDRIHA